MCCLYGKASANIIRSTKQEIEAAANNIVLKLALILQLPAKVMDVIDNCH